MAYKVIVLQPTRKSLWKAIAWYNDKSSGVGNELLNEFFQTLKILEKNPERHKYIFKPFRRILLKKFPYKMIFRIDERRKTVVVVQFWHDKQDLEPLEKQLKT